MLVGEVAVMVFEPARGPRRSAREGARPEPTPRCAPGGEKGRSCDVIGGVATNVTLRVGDDSSDVRVPARFELLGVHVRSVP